MDSAAQVYLFGGAVISWKMASGDEVLYTRPDAKFDKSKPISGGIPHCFPQFGPGAIQQCAHNPPSARSCKCLYPRTFRKRHAAQGRTKCMLFANAELAHGNP